MTITSNPSGAVTLDLIDSCGRELVRELTFIADLLEKAMSKRVAPWYAAVLETDVGGAVDVQDDTRTHLIEVIDLLHRIEDLVRDEEADQCPIADPLDRAIGLVREPQPRGFSGS
jgi:hypothetical protein